VIPEKYAKDFNIDPEKHAYITPDDPDSKPGEIPYAGYPASVQAFHQLHCLDLIRQSLYFNHEYYRRVHAHAWNDPEDAIQRHVSHCLDAIRQNIICAADMRLTPFQNVGEARHGVFEQTRRCRNYEALRSWTVQHRWVAADSFHPDDEHLATDRVKFPAEHSMEQLWRGW
jgi:hypothetical protein